MEVVLMRGGLKCATVVSGAPSVMKNGINKMHRLFADKLDMMPEVRYRNANMCVIIWFSFIKVPLLSKEHFLGQEAY